MTPASLNSTLFPVREKRSVAKNSYPSESKLTDRRERRMRGESSPRPLQVCRVDWRTATANRVHILFHAAGTLAVLYYRASWLLRRRPLSLDLEAVSWALVFAAELILSFVWALAQAFLWRPVSRDAFPERLPEDGQLPAIDVFIVTADPEKEPTVDVMNTVVSAMALDYPAGKLHVYLSDDGASEITLRAMKQAYGFARPWLSFCKRNKIETRCPEAYFAGSDGGGGGSSSAFREERQRVKVKYESFKENVEKAKEMAKTTQGFFRKGNDHLPQIEIIKDDQETNTCSEEQSKMPLVVYISREKREGYPHHFKAGALNVLLRVSSTMSNSPYILVLDCDMYTNNPESARHAMCFHLDPYLSTTLAFVQFPQIFHSISKKDIYCSQLRSIFKTLWKGCDGLKGPILSGTGFYIKRDALYGTKPGNVSTKEEFKSAEVAELKQSFGTSNEFIASLRQNRRYNLDNRTITYTVPQEATLLASCTYEIDTRWGQQVGFLYGSVVEDYFTSFHLHCRGWISAYCYPARPAFLGSVPINFNDTLVQRKRWATGLLEVGFSRFCPLTFGISSRNSILQSMCYAWLAFHPLHSFALLCYGIIPHLCFLSGISIFPEVSNPWFAVFGAVYISSSSQHLIEVFRSGGSIQHWWNEQRFWMINSLSAHLFACLNIIMKLIGIKEVTFDLTNKTVGEEQIQRYKNGIFDFEGTSMVLVPVTTLSILNVATLFAGVWRLISRGSLHGLFGQLFLQCFILVISYRVLEGNIVRRDKGRVPTYITLWSIALTVILLFVWLTCQIPMYFAF